MSTIPMPVQAGADILASYPLVEQMFSRHGCTRVDADGIDLQANIFTGACTNAIRGEGRP